MDKTSRLLSMAHRLVLVAAIAVLLSVVPASALADKQAYARFADNTLTFYYDENMGLTDTDYSLNTGSEDPAWLSIGTQVYKVVFDKSFSSYRPTTFTSGFAECPSLQVWKGQITLLVMRQRIRTVCSADVRRSRALSYPNSIPQKLRTCQPCFTTALR